jgi:hypothetical protein
MVAAWMLERLVVLSGTSICEAGVRTAMLSNERPERGPRLFMDENPCRHVRLDRQDLPEQLVAYVVRPPRFPGLRPGDAAVIVLDGMLVMSPGHFGDVPLHQRMGKLPIAVVADRFWQPLDRSLRSTGGQRLARIAVLMHEAAHAVSNHVKCPLAALDFIEAHADYRLPDVMLGSCDASSSGAVGVGLETLHVLARNCRSCDIDQPGFLAYQLKMLRQIQLRLREPQEVPAAAGIGLAASRLTHLPNRRFFEASSELLRLSGEPTPGRAARIAWFTRLGDQLEQQGRLDGWSRWSANPGGRPLPDPALVGRWLRAAYAAGESDHNVPLAQMPPCAQFGDPC